MKIPNQLINMRFCRVLFKGKKAFETDWTNKPHTYKQIQKYFPQENYGVMCGKEIRALDDDTPDKELITMFLQHFGNTFRVRDHLYFRFDNGHADKIIFNHPTKLYPNSKGKLSPHMGEVQGEGTYVVGAGSTHPSGEIYEQKNDLAIKEISYKNFCEIFKDFLKPTKKKVVREHKPTSWNGDNITDIPIGNIISFVGLRDMGSGCYQGCHPLHGSENGMNFRVDTTSNTWYCFRCQSGGGPSELIGVMEGIIGCDSAGAACYSNDQAREVIKIAREKYGLASPEKQQPLQPRGWSRVLDIKKIAESRGILNCPSCNNKLSFNSEKGWFGCDTCEYYGGLKKLLTLSIKMEASK